MLNADQVPNPQPETYEIDLYDCIVLFAVCSCRLLLLAVYLCFFCYWNDYHQSLVKLFPCLQTFFMAKNGPSTCNFVPQKHPLQKTKRYPVVFSFKTLQNPLTQVTIWGFYYVLVRIACCAFSNKKLTYELLFRVTISTYK